MTLSRKKQTLNSEWYQPDGQLQRQRNLVGEHSFISVTQKACVHAPLVSADASSHCHSWMENRAEYTLAIDRLGTKVSCCSCSVLSSEVLRGTCQEAGLTAPTPLNPCHMVVCVFLMLAEHYSYLGSLVL